MDSSCSFCCKMWNFKWKQFAVCELWCNFLKIESFLFLQHRLSRQNIHAVSSYSAEKCDLFTGDWIPNPSGPVYTNESCPFIEDHQNCMKNGRPDSGYLYWRWKPQSCELPPFDARRFLELMTNKSLALIGDSISQNHVQSILCMLAVVCMLINLNFMFTKKKNLNFMG